MTDTHQARTIHHAALVWDNALLPPEARHDVGRVAGMVFPTAPKEALEGVVEDLTRRRAAWPLSADRRWIVDVSVDAISPEGVHLTVFEDTGAVDYPKR